MNPPLYQVEIFKSVFKGREDVFAIRWENGNKSGYMPAVLYDPYFHRTHRVKQNYEDKTYLLLNNFEIEKHLKGEQLIGIYPLLKDNTTWFLAADFDKDNWIEQCRAFIGSCSKQDIPSYLERSRSGKGGHVWIFFEQPYPAIRSRKIFTTILEQAGIFSVFDKNSSFDRLFPNQDFLSGKGFGNLIALPLFKKKMGKNTFGMERYFKFIEETEKEIIIPRGFVGRLLRYCKENKIEFDFKDERLKLKEIPFLFDTILRGYQQPLINNVSKKDLGIIVAPPGSGKTIMGLYIIAQKKQPALIITHRKQIAEQWMERIETFLGIPQRDIGKIGQGKTKIGKQVTVAMIQSLSKELENPDSTHLLNAFGTIIVDEYHHIPADIFKNTIAKLQTFYLYGLTATPFRKYNDGKLIFIHLGEIIAEIKSEKISTNQKPKIIIRNTELEVPFNSKTDKFETLSKILIHDSARNKLILQDVKTELGAGEKVVIITERKEHIDSLYQYLKQSHETITLSGEDSESNRTIKWKNLNKGN